MVGVEAGGEGVNTSHHSATLSKGTKGVLHGVRTYILQSPSGQILGTHSISAGLDYPGVGPEHAFLKDSGRAEYVVADDVEALKGFRMCTELEGIIPALETAHAIWATVELAKSMDKDQDVVMVRTPSSRHKSRTLIRRRTVPFRAGGQGRGADQRAAAQVCREARLVRRFVIAVLQCTHHRGRRARRTRA